VCLAGRPRRRHPEAGVSVPSGTGIQQASPPACAGQTPANYARVGLPHYPLGRIEIPGGARTPPPSLFDDLR
jgi:hypothetical protein